MTGVPEDDGRRVVLVSVNGVREVDPTWLAWLARDQAILTGESCSLVVVDVHRGTSS